MTKKVLIFFPHPLRERHGGPYSYLFHLKEGLKDLNHSISFLSDDLKPALANKTSNQSPSLLKKIIGKFIPAKWKNNYKARNWFRQLKNKRPAVSHDYINQFDILHFHETNDIWHYLHLLNNFKGKILLTSHTPKPYHLELIEDVWNISPADLSKKMFNKLEQVDWFAFEKTNIIVSACKEATESYHSFWPEFSNITRHKKFHFIPTGIKKQIASTTATDIRKQFNIPETAFVFCFTGRKSEVKGFGLLVDAAKIILDKNTTAYFFIIGNRDSLPAMKNTRWIETGWTDDPQSFISASDLVVIPNRHTYFDLSVLETLSLSKPMLLSYTGGNKYFKQFQSPGIFYHNPDTESLVNEMMNCINKKEILSDGGLENEKLYEKYFRCEPFAKNMIDFYNNLA